MDLKNYSTGVQHIGIPTNDIDKTVDFYHKLGFETAFENILNFFKNNCKKVINVLGCELKHVLIKQGFC